MDYFKAWISLIGWNEIAFVAVVFVFMFAADRFILWHDKTLPWRGLMNRK